MKIRYPVLLKIATYYILFILVSTTIMGFRAILRHWSWTSLVLGILVLGFCCAALVGIYLKLNWGRLAASGAISFWMTSFASGAIKAYTEGKMDVAIGTSALVLLHGLFIWGLFFAPGATAHFSRNVQE